MNTNNKSNMSHNACYAIFYPGLGLYLSPRRHLTTLSNARLFKTNNAAADFAPTDIWSGYAVVEEIRS